MLSRTCFSVPLVFHVKLMIRLLWSVTRVGSAGTAALSYAIVVVAPAGLVSFEGAPHLFTQNVLESPVRGPSTTIVAELVAMVGVFVVCQSPRDWTGVRVKTAEPA